MIRILYLLTHYHGISLRLCPLTFVYEKKDEANLRGVITSVTAWARIAHTI